MGLREQNKDILIKLKATIIGSEEDEALGAYFKDML